MASLLPYHLYFEERDEYLFAQVTADNIDRQTAMHYLSELATRLKSSGKKRLMLERKIPVMLSDADLFHTTVDFLEMIRGTKTAFVNPFAPIDESMNFAMTIGNNRGAIYELFSDVESADRWLLS